MRLLVIGASGFLGGRILRHFKRLGVPVLGTQAQSRQPDLITFDVVSDTIDSKIPASFFSPNDDLYAVVSVVSGSVDECKKDPQMSAAVNVKGTIQVIEQLQERGVTPVYLSSSYVFDGQTGGYKESSPPHPINEYGRQKCQVEDFLRDNIPKGIVLRLDKVVGDDPKENHLFSEWARDARAGKPIRCIQGQVLAPTFVDDVAKALEICCAKNLRGLHNVNNMELFNREDLARRFLAVVGFPGTVSAVPLAEFKFLDFRPLRTHMDPSEFIDRTEIKFTPMNEVFHRFKEKLP